MSPKQLTLKAEELRLSTEATEVLAGLTQFWHAALPHRETFADQHPELHLLAWDAGVYQLKHLWREHRPSEWKALQVAQKRLAEKLQEGVYDHGFLRKGG